MERLLQVKAPPPLPGKNKSILVETKDSAVELITSLDFLLSKSPPNVYSIYQTEQFRIATAKLKQQTAGDSYCATVQHTLKLQNVICSY